MLGNNDYKIYNRIEQRKQEDEVLKAKKMKQYWQKFQKKGPAYFARVKYNNYLKEPIQNNVILIESKHGDEIASNLFALLKEATTNDAYKDYKVYVVYNARKLKVFEAMIERYGLKGMELVELNTPKYYELCATAKYLISDTTFLPFYIKRDGQVYLNTWHGTPLKCLGRSSNDDYYKLGNVQRNFMMADYLLYPNDYTCDHMINDYMLDKLAPNPKALLEGYPRNSIFFKDSDQRIREWLVKDELIKGNEKLYFYMPTWRETKDPQITQQLAVHILAVQLLEIDRRLNKDEVMFIKLHPLAKKAINLNCFEHIKPYPAGLGYETYDFLNACDVLITDYSSVFFDFEIKGRKIVLFDYDKEDYLDCRGTYFDMNELPFPQVRTIDDLMHEIRTPKTYDDQGIIKKFNQYDKEDAPARVLSTLLTGKGNLKDIYKPTDKRTVLIYTGDLAKNGITTSLMNMINTIDKSKYNIVLCYTEAKVRNHPEVIKTFPKDIQYMAIMGATNMTLSEKVRFILHTNDLYPTWMIKGAIKRVYEKEVKRVFPYMHIDSAIQFCGYESKKTYFWSVLPNNSIFVHNDMVQEIKTKHNQIRTVLKYAYRKYDHVALVTEDMEEPTKAFTRGKTDNFMVVANIIDYKGIKEKGMQEIVFDKETECRLTLKELKAWIKNHDQVFINVGRFSPEKNQAELVEAFWKVKENNPKKNLGLILLGGNGVLKDDLLEMTKEDEDIVLVKAMKNPQPLVKACDCFVLSSKYEGQGLVIMEADIQGIPVISTDIGGPHSFMKDSEATLVEPTVEGLVEGMQKFIDGKAKNLNMDYKAYNEEAIEAWKKIM